MKYTVIGRALPERANIQFEEITWRSSAQIAVSVKCEASQVTVTVDDTRVDGDISAFVTAEHIASTIVSCLGFALATSYSVELVQLVGDSGTQVVGKRIEGLMFDEPGGIFERATMLARLDLHFRFAVSDYTAALSRPIDCGFLCYRAMESIKSSFGSAQGRTPWEVFHQALGTNQAEILEKVKSFADPVRHGNWEELPQTSAAQRFAMLSLTRDILERYLNLKSPRP